MRIELKALPPAEAVALFRQKGLTIGFAWQDVWKESHAAAFTVAKAMRADVLEAIRKEVDRALIEGRTLRQFRNDLTPTLQKLGWRGKAPVTDPLTSETVLAQLGSPRRLRTIYDVNMRASLAAGQWQRINRVRARRPYLRYSAVLDDRTRPDHRAWHGTVLRIDDPWWNTHFPPNGWNCRCTTQQLSERDLRRFKLEVGTSPAIQRRAFRNRRTGEVAQVPIGIDPGWDYNVGDAWLRRLRSLEADKLQGFAPDLRRQLISTRVRESDVSPFLRGVTTASTPIQLPVAALPESVSAALGTNASVARLSRETASKIREKHPAVRALDLARLQRILDDGELFLDGDRHLVGFVQQGDKWWRAVFKRTADGREVFLVSLHPSNEKQRARAESKPGRNKVVD